MRSHRSRTAVDRRLERAKAVTRRGPYTSLESARFAEDLVLVVEAHPPQAWLLKAVDKRLREALAVLRVTLHEAKSRTVDLAQGESVGCLGCACRRIRSRAGKGRASSPPLLPKRSALLRKLQDLFRRDQSQPIDRVSSLLTPIVRGWGRSGAIGEASRCVGFLKDWVEKTVRRHVMRARKRRGLGWKRWRRQWRYKGLRLCTDYRVRRPRLQALPAQEVP